MTSFLATSGRRRNFAALYGAMTLLSLHWAVVLYINSSYLEQFISPSAVGMLYTVSSAVTVLIFLFISRVLQRVGNFYLTLALALAECTAILGMAFAESLRTAIPLFLIHQAVIPLIFFNLDVYLEGLVGVNESETGGRRGLYLALMAFAGALAPLASGFLVSKTDQAFTPAYIASGVLMLPFIYIITQNFRTFSEPGYSSIDIFSTIRSFWERADIRNVFCAHFLLQFFFAWMVIYTPLYLVQYGGFDWNEIGLILFVGLMAYVFFEYPAGLLADAHYGETEMMLFGFVIIGISTATLAFIAPGAMAVWMLALFMTRVGASLVETTTESYFFKHTRDTDANVISFFRITRPLSYVAGALLGSLTLLYLPFNMLFVVLGMIMLSGIVFSLELTDTR